MKEERKERYPRPPRSTRPGSKRRVEKWGIFFCQHWFSLIFFFFCPSVSLSLSGRRKSVRYAFATKRFYLDLKTTKVGSVKIRQLVEDIQLLGGVRERGRKKITF